MKERKFSVSMCVYGKDNPIWFETAVESILNQTMKPAEVVLVVDGPVPDALDVVIQKYEANAIFKVIRFAENKGHGEARRAGLAACAHELVAIMDADDISVHNRFEKQLQVFEQDAAVAIVGGIITEFVGEDNNIVGKREVPKTDVEIKKYMKDRCPMNLVTVMFKKDMIEQVGGFIDWYCEEDYYLWVRMALANMKFANVSDILVNVRVGNEMYQRRGGWKYFKSEAKLQKLMLSKKLIGLPKFFINVMERFVLQVLMPNRLRGWVFQKFARKKA